MRNKDTRCFNMCKKKLFRLRFGLGFQKVPLSISPVFAVFGRKKRRAIARRSTLKNSRILHTKLKTMFLKNAPPLSGATELNFHQSED